MGYIFLEATKIKFKKKKQALAGQIHAQTSALMKTQTSDVKTCNGQSLGCISHLSEECGSGP